jgi:hypothetical protein
MKNKIEKELLLTGKSGGRYFPKLKSELIQNQNGVTLKYNGHICFMPDYISIISFVTYN